MLWAKDACVYRKGVSLQGHVHRVDVEGKEEHMTDKVRYTFKIEDFTPETMQLRRLVEYYRELEKLLGGKDHIHLIEIFESSHGTALAIDHDYAKKAEVRIEVRVMAQGQKVP